jgi:4-aminobutyrate aminotransferase-like enzyme/Ser/Thr protein kinase RdoA (MazF antagonist)
MRKDQQGSPERTDKGKLEGQEAPGLAITARGMGFVPPRLPTRDLQEAALDLFGVRGELHALDGEREQNCHIRALDGAEYVLKVSRHDEDPQLIDFQLRALVHLQETAPTLPVPRVFRTRNGGLSATLMGDQGQRHTLRLLSYLPGQVLARGPAPSMAALQDIGALQARICLGLRGYFHPAARNFVPWDLSQGLVLHPDLVRGIPAEVWHEVQPVLLRLRTQVLPRLAGLRAQVIHHDAHFGNLLCDPSGSETITGVIDFGDMIHGPLAMELAVSMASVAEAYNDFPAAASLLARGFHDVVALEAEEIDLLLDLTLARLILTVQLTALKTVELGAASGTEMPAYIAAFRSLAALDRTEFARRLNADCGLPSTRVASPAEPARLIERRKAALGPAAALFYDEPVHIVRGRDVWLYDSQGREYLDCYNNVPSVGHCHPRVVNALAYQARTLNTHTRYLHETVVRYAEKIAATMPGDLSVCFFTCTGSEANDLAFRIARVVTGAAGTIVTENAYHGTTLAATQLSPSEYPSQERPDWLEAVAPPDLYRGPFGSADKHVGATYAGLIEKAVEALGGRGIRPAMFMYDAIFDAAGIHTAPAGYLARAHRAVRAAGGLVVADEVQAGLCRLGEHVWGFQDSGVVPDIVTLGKPMGNGHPIAAVVTTPEIAEAFAAKFSYFNTFAGNPVSAAVGLAVLDVVEEEGLLGSVSEAGKGLGAGLQALSVRHEAIGDIRGKGLFWGLEVVGDRESRLPAPDLAACVVEVMRRDGVLIAASGPYRNILKIRPPLTFRPLHAERLLSALDRALSQITAQTNG